MEGWGQVEGIAGWIAREWGGVDRVEKAGGVAALQSSSETEVKWDRRDDGEIGMMTSGNLERHVEDDGRDYILC